MTTAYMQRRGMSSGKSNKACVQPVRDMGERAGTPEGGWMRRCSVPCIDPKETRQGNVRIGRGRGDGGARHNADGKTGLDREDVAGATGRGVYRRREKMVLHRIQTSPHLRQNHRLRAGPCERAESHAAHKGSDLCEEEGQRVSGVWGEGKLVEWEEEPGLCNAGARCGPYTGGGDEVRHGLVHRAATDAWGVGDKRKEGMRGTRAQTAQPLRVEPFGQLEHRRAEGEVAGDGRSRDGLGEPRDEGVGVRVDGAEKLGGGGHGDFVTVKCGFMAVHEELLVRLGARLYVGTRCFFSVSILTPVERDKSQASRLESLKPGNGQSAPMQCERASPLSIGSPRSTRTQATRCSERKVHFPIQRVHTYSDRGAPLLEIATDLDDSKHEITRLHAADTLEIGLPRQYSRGNKRDGQPVDGWSAPTVDRGARKHAPSVGGPRSTRGQAMALRNPIYSNFDTRLNCYVDPPSNPDTRRMVRTHISCHVSSELTILQYPKTWMNMTPCEGGLALELPSLDIFLGLRILTQLLWMEERAGLALWQTIHARIMLWPMLMLILQHRLRNRT
ncbi:hypothetical protein B0H17DRAFT_1136157 [Mycena rosella]|uniref:Uncharacterized protein n=1 Tax=Mycena rosella TaxID=1033263 RepID=A0AAD7DBV6_MYCRO|nr:hypothetical protein B0H17DRAFT_1136157 [Mycena rosella]